MAASRDMLTAVLNDVVALKDVATHLLSDRETDAWDSLQPVIKVAKVEQAVLHGHSTETMRTLLEFLTGYATKRKVLKNRILDVLQTLLEDPDWLSTVQLPPMELQTQLVKLYEKDEAMRKRLVEHPVVEAELADRVLRVRRASGVGDDIQKKLLTGIRIMQDFAWKFPPPSATSSDADTATQGFVNFYRGVARLCYTIERYRLQQTDAERLTAELTEGLGELWPGVLQFVVSMRDEKQSFVSQINLVGWKLSFLLPSFRTAARDAHIDFAISDHTCLESAAEEMPSESCGCHSPPEVCPCGIECAPGAASCHDSDSSSDTSDTSPLVGGYPTTDTPHVALAEQMQNEDEDFAMALELQASYMDLSTAMRHEKKVLRCRWMWADARILPLPGMKLAARADPFGKRWSAFQSPEEIAKELDAYQDSKHSARRVLIDVEGKGKGKAKFKFQDPRKAAETLRDELLLGLIGFGLTP